MRWQVVSAEGAQCAPFDSVDRNLITPLQGADEFHGKHQPGALPLAVSTHAFSVKQADFSVKQDHSNETAPQYRVRSGT